MNKKILLFNILISILTCSISYADGFYSVYSKDGNDVWAGGLGGSLFRSYDGGNTWYSFTLGSGNHNAVFAVNQKVWVSENPGIVYYSLNNGYSWNLVSVPVTEINSMSFIDEYTGWLAGSDGKIFATANGGFTWTLQTTPVNTRYTSIKFNSYSDGLACGSGGIVIYTTNAGATWIQSPTPTLNNLTSIDRKSGTIIAGAEDAVIIKSTNNGNTWSIIDYKIQTKSNVNSIYMVDANTFYSAGGGGFIRKSVDGGITFTYQINPMLANLVSIYFYDLNKGWAVSSKNNAVIRTTDGGNTWLLPEGTTVSYNWAQKLSAGGNLGNDISLFSKDKRVIFVCCGTTVYRSPDIGETWSSVATISFSGQANSFYISPRDTNLMLASLGGSGRIVRSTNYGLNWITTWGPGSMTYYGVPLEMDPNHPDTVYFGPNSSVLLRSTDFGLTFSPIGTTTFNDPCDFAVLPGNSNILYCGDQNSGGQFYKSTDFGINWFLAGSVGGSEIPMIGISSLNYNLIYHTNWGGSGFRRSTDQGLNWTLVYSTGSTWGCDIAKDDPNVPAFGTYGGGTVYISTNGGNNFIVTSISGANYGVLYYDRGTLLTQQSGGMFKMTVNYNVPVFTGITLTNEELPKDFALRQNYPNPFNPVTKIEFSVKRMSYIEINIYNSAGQKIKSLVSQNLGAGRYSVNADASDLASGIYFYTLISGGTRIDTKKMLLIR